MAGQVRWNGDRLAAQVRAEMGRRLDACRVEVANHAKELVGVEGAEKTTVTVTDARGRKRKRTRLRYGANPSAPGEPPHKQTGRLQSSITSEREDLVARAGTNVTYGRSLELGTSRMAPRPWLRRALAERLAFIRAVMSRPLNLRP